ncbi:hypothetical protein AC579_6497 [Pseudocercospora musae]|uniref:Uncharacterized protein n=1 Tax=Pseudocercospora musae TaxID=113226 RepID=A0A139I0I8_9PEZI|nr:hypothetical protein AC579_6497 [Pseudocercospora musae]
MPITHACVSKGTLLAVVTHLQCVSIAIISRIPIHQNHLLYKARHHAVHSISRQLVFANILVQLRRVSPVRFLTPSWARTPASLAVHGVPSTPCPSHRADGGNECIEQLLADRTTELHNLKRLLKQERRTYQAQLKSQAESNQKRSVALNQMAVHASKVAYTKLREQITSLVEQLAEERKAFDSAKAKHRSNAGVIMHIRRRITERDECTHSLRATLTRQSLAKDGRLRARLAIRAEVCLVALEPDRSGSQQVFDVTVAQSSIPIPQQTLSTPSDPIIRASHCLALEMEAQPQSCPKDAMDGQTLDLSKDPVSSSDLGAVSTNDSVPRASKEPTPADEIRDTSPSRKSPEVGAISSGEGAVSAALGRQATESLLECVSDNRLADHTIDPDNEPTHSQNIANHRSDGLVRCYTSHGALASDFFGGNNVTDVRPTMYCKTCRENRKRATERRKRARR